MHHPTVHPLLDPRTRATLAAELAQASNNPKLRRQLERQWRGRLGALALLLALGQAPAWAASLTVNSLADTATAGDTECTLREAINNANSDSDTTSGDCVAGAGADTIGFSLSGTITLGSTLPAMTDATGLTIDGSGQSVTVSGNNAVRVMQVNAGATLDLENLTVANANAGLGGGIRNNGTLTVTNSTFSGNSATLGGGILNDNGSTLTVSNSTFSGNGAQAFGGGIHSGNGATLTVSNSTFSGNTADLGGGSIALKP